MPEQVPIFIRVWVWAARHRMALLLGSSLIATILIAIARRYFGSLEFHGPMGP